MKDSEEFDRAHRTYPIRELLSHIPQTYKRIRAVWITAGIVMSVAWSMVTIFGAYGLRSFPGAEGLANDIMPFAKIVIPAIAAIEQKVQWVTNGSMAISLQLLLLLGWVVTLVSFFIFWRIVKAVDRKDWAEIHIKLQVTKQGDRMWVGSVIFLMLILCMNYFSFFISVFNAAPMTPIAIGFGFVALIYFGQIIVILLFSRIRGS